MRKIYFISILALLAACLLSSKCSNLSSNQGMKQKYSSLDSIWLPFVGAMESKDIMFLVQNSTDSIRCCECQIEEDAQNEFYNSEYIFNNQLEKLMHLETLSDRYFSSYQVDSITLRIVYSVRSNQAPEGSYSLFYTLTKVNNKYLFQGMMVQ